ncbi:MAG TPA: VCBS repeat-containing protein, partial [Puia sp.]|nr:VCBS repeat-containing protein [Puia sp.]
TEMLPENDYRLKTTIKFDNYDVQTARNQLDFHHQFTANCLQLNNHDGTFSEIAQLAGVDATGWSWGALGFDFDNDGWKDLFVSNGISRDLTDQDFLEYFTNKDVMRQLIQNGFSYQDLIHKMPSVPIRNYAFVNQRNLRFRDLSDSLGLGTPTFSNGAAYADLDGDGDLDLVINNENAEASVYRNMSSEKLHHHFLKVKLKGNAPNTFGFGSRVTLYCQGNEQVMEEMPSRGFQSSMDPVLNFGLGNGHVVDSLIVRWTNGGLQVMKGLAVDTLLLLDEKDARMPTDKSVKPVKPWFENVAARQIRGNYRHRENDFVDFDNESLIPKMLSTEGPKIAVGDVNGDGLEDFYMGSAFGDTAKIFIQQPDGRFVQKQQPAFIRDKYFENTGAAFFDADGDGDLDLVVASGGNQAGPGSSYLFPRLYLNDGKGNFSAALTGWPSVALNASCVRILDYNADGKPDVFIGARNVPGTYGVPPSSVLLRNDGQGHFTDVTATAAPDLQKLGMVTDACWRDIDGDGQGELILVGDWMPVCIFKYQDGKLRKTGEIPHSSGWWNCLTIADINGDGYPDLLAGNFGLNSNIKADPEHPAKLYVGDFAKNGKTICIPAYYKTDGKSYPYYLKGEMEKQIPQLKKKFLKFSEYAGKTMEEVFSENQLKQSSVLSVEQTQTVVFINNGKGQFDMEPLPVRAQLSPVFGILAKDFNGDGIIDLFIAGNFFGLKPQTGRLDANYGTLLLGDATHHFTYVEPAKSGLFLQGEARDIASVKSARGGSYIIVAMNNDALYLFR